MNKSAGNNASYDCAEAAPPFGGKERDFTASGDIVDAIQELIPEARREETTDGG